jgi:hypothetical protein
VGLFSKSTRSVPEGVFVRCGRASAISSLEQLNRDRARQRESDKEAFEKYSKQAKIARRQAREARAAGEHTRAWECEQAAEEAQTTADRFERRL